MKRFAIALLLGAAAGALCLGVGGRLAMHGLARAMSRSNGFTLGGTLGVVLAGAIAGAIGGIVFAAIERFLPKRRWLRGLGFAALCYLIATPGMRPPRPLVFAVFAPTFLAYGLVMERLWARVGAARRA